jgi:hypothetical protein
MRNLVSKVALLLIVLSSTALLNAQDSASMTGVVTDLSGAVIPGTTVTLTNPSTGVKFTDTTNSQGSYRFPNIPPQTGYVTAFSHAGFSTFTVGNIALQVGITRTQNATLQAGTNVQIDVSAANQDVTINTTDASIGNNFSVELLDDLPVQDRATGLQTLFTLQPGYAAGTGSFVGARTDQNSVTLDGMDVNDIAAAPTITNSGSIVAFAPVDSVQEFRGVVTGLGANLGTGGGAEFQLVTKDGTNTFHGDLNEYHRDTSTVANTWFNNNTGLPRTPLIRNQFGGAIGGPILKNKLFFFFDFNTDRIVQSGTAERTVPLDTFRNGTLGYIYANAGGVSTGSPCTAASRANTTPSCIGYLSSAQVAALDPQGIGFNQPLLSFINTRYPHVNDVTTGDGVNTGGYRFTQPDPDFTTNYVARVDYNLTSHQRIFGRMTIGRENAFEALNFLPTDPITSPYVDRSYGYVISHIWQIGQNKVNQFYYGDTISKLNFPNDYNQTGAVQYGFGGLSGPYSSPSSQHRRVPIPEVRDDFNWTQGNHNLSFGGTFKFIKTNSNLTNDFSSVAVGLGGFTSQLNPSLRPGNILTTGTTTATSDYDSLFTMSLGRIASIGSNYNYTNTGTALPQGTGANRAYRYYETEAYAGDTWKITKNLTMSYGVRYQLYSVPYEVHGLESVQNQSFDKLFNARVVAGQASQSGDNVIPFVVYNLGGKANNGPPLYNPSYKDFAPRLALAYSPNSKTVFNMSAALVYDRTVIDALAFIQDQNSFLFQNSTAQSYGQTNANAALLADPRLGPNLALPVPLPTTSAITKPYTPYVSGTTPTGGPEGNGYSQIVDPNLKDPYSISLNAGMQEDLGGNFILKINYAGRLGRRLLAQADASQVVDFKDPVSGQEFSQALGNVTQELRAGTAVTNQPWFENMIGAGATPFLVANLGSYMVLGDIADFANALEENGLTNTNVNVGAQFALNPWFTNKGFSSYNGLLVTLTKNMSHGVQFDLNYTLSHSIDNVSAPANYIAANSPYVNFVCDAHQPRACRGNSDFDVSNVISSDFVANLPVGRGKELLGNAPRWLDEVVGGWSVSGTPQWSSGVAFGLVSNAFGASFNENEPPRFDGNRGAVQAHPHKTSSGQVQLFTDPAAANAAFTGPVGLTFGSRNNLRGPSAFNMDAGLGKKFPLVSKVDLKFRADFFNVLNHPVFSAPSNTPGSGGDITSGSFGQITGTSNSYRVGQFSLRLEF